MFRRPFTENQHKTPALRDGRRQIDPGPLNPATEKALRDPHTTDGEKAVHAAVAHTRERGG
jgi:hypothetical protein